MVNFENELKKVLEKNRPALDQIAKTLIEKESIEREEFGQMMSAFKIEKK